MVRTTNESTRTVAIALAAGGAVAFAKVGAAIVTGSSALAAEASHSLADTTNDLFLFVAERRGSRGASEQHPLGHGREAYFWALIAACGAFFAGAAFSLRDGINQLIHPSVTSSFAVGYIVLAISAVFDLASFRQSAGQIVRSSRRSSRSVLEESRGTSDAPLRAVFMADAVAVSGDVFAVAALALTQITGSTVPQAIAAVLIGSLLIRINLRLIKRSHDFLVGVWVLTPVSSETRRREITQAIPAAEAARMRAFLSSYPGVTNTRELLVHFVGPRRLWVVARVEIDAGLCCNQVASLVAGIEAGMKRASESVYRVDVVPISVRSVELEA